MSKIRSIVAAQSSVGEPEHRGDERSEAARSGGSPTFEPDVVPVVPDSEVPARHARRRVLPSSSVSGQPVARLRATVWARFREMQFSHRQGLDLK